MYKNFDLAVEKANNPACLPQNPFEHQKDAFKKLSQVYNFKEHKAGILVLPTGAGKTFTSVNWICNNVLPKNIKVLWLAHTSHLLEQAYDEFSKNILQVYPLRKTVNIRVVSSNPKHANASQIKISDDILVITTQTAISNFESLALDSKGNKRKTEFESFLAHANSTGLFVVLDEAHHAPAYGCRNLLIGGNRFKNGIRQIVPNSNFLGLTATPSYTDKNRRGWLWEIFKDKIIHEVDKTDLQKAGILAIAKRHEKLTGEAFELPEKDYQDVIREHKDLPEWVVEQMANSKERNNYIVQEYVKNKNYYGKTIIFADRNFQCVYLKEKLLEAGVKAGAIFTYTDATPRTAEERNKCTSTENDKILQNFKSNELDVLINIRMLTEGTDVPDVNTVFITRQTTSQILLTQMIGRALRGTKAQKNGKQKDTANIVFFTDTWKQVINFASFEGGGTSEHEIKIRGRYPIEWISIKLIEELARKMDSGVVFSDQPFLSYLPLGWYETEARIAVGEDYRLFKEFIVVSEELKAKVDKFINYLLKNISPEWENESLSEDFMQGQAKKWLLQYFDEADNQSNTLDFDLIKIARHIGQSNPKAAPSFILFAERNKHDLSKLSLEVVQNKMDDLAIDDLLRQEYDSSEKLWQEFYKDYHRFTSAFDAERRRAIHIIKYGKEPQLNISKPELILQDREPTEEIKEKIFKHDNYTCQCCGRIINPKRKTERKQLHIDHIIPYKFGGDSSEKNLQTLCVTCNGYKSIHEINFRITKTPLTSFKDLDLFDINTKDNLDLVIRRIINFYYHSKAVLSLDMTTPKGRLKQVWQVELYPGNNPQWLENEKPKLMSYIKEELQHPKLEQLIIK